MKKRLILKIVIPLLALGLVFASAVGVAFFGVFAAQASAAECQLQQANLPSKIPKQIGAIAAAAGKTWGVPAYAVLLVYYDENGLTYNREPPPPYGHGKPWPVSSAHAEGPMQIRPGTARELRNSNPAHQPGDVNDLVDAFYMAAHYLSIQGAKTTSEFGDPQNPKKGTIIWALGAYNAGAHSGFETWQHHAYRENAAAEYNRTFAHVSSLTPINTGTLVSICNGQDNTGDNDDGSLPSGDCPADSPASVVTMGNGTRIKVCRVNGMVVNVRIAGKWAKLVQMAKAYGINLSGGGFRTASQQIALRKAHCGTSHYAIYEMPASRCTPDTARPGTSNHEKALAVDLYHASSYSSRVYTWMRIHGPPLGIEAHVPGEPWHWSLGGH